MSNSSADYYAYKQAYWCEYCLDNVGVEEYPDPRDPERTCLLCRGCIAGWEELADNENLLRQERGRAA